MIIEFLRILFLMMASAFCLMSAIQILTSKTSEDKISGMFSVLFGITQILVLGFWHQTFILLVISIIMNITAMISVLKAKKMIESGKELMSSTNAEKSRALGMISIFKYFLLINICTHLLLCLKSYLN